MARICRPVWASHSRMKLSAPPDATSRPSGLKATLLTCITWPVRDLNSFPVAASQILALRSRPPEASSFPSGLKARESTPPGCAAGIVRSSVPFSRSQRRMVPSNPDEASLGPEGSNATESTSPA